MSTLQFTRAELAPSCESVSCSNYHEVSTSIHTHMRTTLQIVRLKIVY
jgi:hypothetical protein